LKKGFNGVKTGNTPAAGPCLCTSYFKDKLHIVVVVLDSKNMENRWDDSVKLTFWAINRLEAIYEHFTGGKKILRPKIVPPSMPETSSTSKNTVVSQPVSKESKQEDL